MGAMKGRVDVLGSKIWAAKAIAPKRESQEKKKTDLDGTLSEKSVVWDQRVDRDWSEVAPLQWGGQGKSSKNVGKRRRSGGDVSDSQRRVRGKQRGEYSAKPAGQPTEVSQPSLQTTNIEMFCLTY